MLETARYCHLVTATVVPPARRCTRREVVPRGEGCKMVCRVRARAPLQLRVGYLATRLIGRGGESARGEAARSFRAGKMMAGQLEVAGERSSGWPLRCHPPAAAALRQELACPAKLDVLRCST
eukprot:scaffold4147_cov412-Prasinococcus_capsulatus_cf.AAC.7